MNRNNTKKLMDFIYKNRVVLIVVLLGFLFRAVLMPFTIHHDILSSIWRGTLLVFEGSYRISHFSELIMAFYIFIMKSFLPHLPDLLGSHSTLTIGPDHGVYSEFLASTYSFRYIFIVKLLFLIIDSLLLLAVLKSKFRKQLSVIIFWAINPFILYGVYMWGRYEILPVLITFLSMLSLTKEKKWQAVILAGIAVSFRVTFLVYLIPLLIYVSANKKEFTKFIIVGLTPYLLTSTLTKHFIQSYSGIGGDFQEFLFLGTIGQGFNSISLFPLFLFLIVYLMLKDRATQRLNYKRYVYYTGMIISSYFAFTFFHPQWLAWLTPIAMMYVYYEKKCIYTLLIAFVFFFIFIDCYWGPYTSTNLLFEASNPDFARAFFSIKYQLLGKYSDQTLVTISHTMFVLSLVLLNMQLKVKLYDKEI